VTIFIVVCVAMLVAALALVVRPLMKGHSAWPTLSALSLLVPIVAIGIYWKVGHRTWQQDQAAVELQAAAQKDLVANIGRLEERIREEPRDVDAMLTLAEALIAQDERAIAGRGGELVEIALAQAPNNAKALWYGAISALSAGKLPVARDRLQRVLTMNPPENIRSIIERQIQDIDQQLGETQPQVASSGPMLDVQVALDPALIGKVEKSTSLFVLARDPINGGPPLAAVRRTVADLPLAITLTDNDAMMSGRGISSVSSVQVVARISKSGTPQAQVGDLYGDTTVELKDTKRAAVKITIDRKVEK
jgi:cytochrome c-type biogenesis protein CcmH